MFTFPILDQKYPKKRSVWAAIWYQGLFKCAKFNGEFHFFVLGWKYPFWASLVQIIKIALLS